MTIKFYKTKDPYGFMSNFYKARFFIYGRWWNFVEAPYQAEKTSIQSEKDSIWAAEKAMDSRLIGQKVNMRPDWDQVKRQVMYECCLAKFLQHTDLRKQLLETGNEELMEDSPVDYYWGCGADGTGKNVLGQVLMQIREELRDRSEWDYEVLGHPAWCSVNACGMGKPEGQKNPCNCGYEKWEKEKKDKNDKAT